MKSSRIVHTLLLVAVAVTMVVCLRKETRDLRVKRGIKDHPVADAAEIIDYRNQENVNLRLNLTISENLNIINNNNRVELFIKQHEKLILKCDVNINYTNNIWLKNGAIVDSVLLDVANKRGISGHRFLRDHLGNLVVDTVRLEDNGRWQCEAEDPNGYIMTGKLIDVIVLDPPKPPYLLIDNRRLDPGNLFVPVKENAELNIQCVTEGGNPQPKLRWDLAIAQNLEPSDVPAQALNFSIFTTEPNNEYTTEGSVNMALSDGAMSEVRLRVLRAHHNATISCLVDHITLKQSLQASLLLDVQYSPSFAISREPGFGIPIFEGMPVSLKCDVDANPPALPIWRKDDTVPPVMQSPDGYLNFTAIHREHSGWYKCTAKYLSSQFSSLGYFLNVRFEALIVDVTQEPEYDVGELSSTTNSRNKQVDVALGGAVQLKCPAGTGCWTRVNSENAKLMPMGPSQDLRLDRILYQEAGEYRCVAPGKEYKKKMEAIRNALVVNIKVIGRPTAFPLNQTISVHIGHSTYAAVEFCANPPYSKAYWLSDANIYRPEQKSSNFVVHYISNSSSAINCYVSKLVFQSVDISHHGEYTFLVHSFSGIAESSMFLNVTSNYPNIQTSEDSLNDFVGSNNLENNAKCNIKSDNYLLLLYSLLIVSKFVHNNILLSRYYICDM